MSPSDPWPGLELRHLVAFRAVARECSFRAAATSLGFTQAAVSQQLALLERRLGRRLVERRSGHRGIELTEAGELLLRHAHEILRHVALARSDLRAQEAGAGAALQIGTFHSFSARLLPSIVALYAREHPDTVLGLVEERSADHLLELVAEGELDLAFVDVPAPGADFEVQPLFDDPYVVLVPVGSPLAGQAQIALDDLQGLPIIGFSSVGSQRLLERTALLGGGRLNVVYRSDETATLHTLVSAGVGYAIVPRLAHDPASREVAAVPADPRLTPRPVSLMWSSQRSHTPAAAAFVEATARTLGRLAKVA